VAVLILLFPRALIRIYYTSHSASQPKIRAGQSHSPPFELAQKLFCTNMVAHTASSAASDNAMAIDNVEHEGHPPLDSYSHLYSTLENDANGQPGGILMTSVAQEVIDGLWIGGFTAAESLHFLQKERISYILSLGHFKPHHVDKGIVNKVNNSRSMKYRGFTPPLTVTPMKILLTFIFACCYVLLLDHRSVRCATAKHDTVFR
jgi:hypothetical protein